MSIISNMGCLKWVDLVKTTLVSFDVSRMYFFELYIFFLFCLIFVVALCIYFESVISRNINLC